MLKIEREKLSKSSLSPNFIGSWMIEPTICDNLISYFEKNKKQQMQGETSGGFNVESKDRKDIIISPNQLSLPGNEVFKLYFETLYDCYKDYNCQWPFLAKTVSHLDIGSFNIGKYIPGQHFQSTHCERSGLNTLHRLLAFMTYLNDVEDGGSTYFDHYGLDIKPQKGLTLLWPCEWTHSHKGNVLNSGVKYIITGWLSFPK